LIFVWNSIKSGADALDGVWNYASDGLSKRQVYAMGVFFVELGGKPHAFKQSATSEKTGDIFQTRPMNFGVKGSHISEDALRLSLA